MTSSAIPRVSLRQAAIARGASLKTAVHPGFAAAAISSPPAANLETEAPAKKLIVGVVPDAAIYGWSHTLASGGSVVQDSIYLAKDAADTMRRSSAAKSAIGGTALVAGNAYTGGYYHWVAQVLPALIHCQQFDAGPVTYVTPRMKPWMRESFSLVADPRMPVVELPATHTLFAPRAMFSTVLSRSSFAAIPVRAKFAARVKAALGLDELKPFRRLYVSRRDTERRPVANAGEVERLCAAAGFEVVVPGELSFRDQVRLFHEAAVVAGAHGGGLTNVLFCQPGAALYEMHQSDVVNPCFAYLCRTIGLRYFYDVFPSSGGRNTEGWRVDPARLERALAHLSAHLDEGPGRHNI